MTSKKLKKSNSIAKILKFGGSSVGSAERIMNVAKIVLAANKNERVAVVVSAMQGVTDKLLARDFQFVKTKTLEAAKLLKVPAPHTLLQELEGVLQGIRMIGDASPAAMDLVASFGERLSAYLVAAYINKKHLAADVDSREFVKTDANFQNAVVDFAKTNSKIRIGLGKIQELPVITGFIGSTDDNRTTTLGRGGSDYSAAIFGAALGVKVVEIWTDANGVMTADPRIVSAAFTLPQISYEEAFEMAYFGAKVIHPATMLPAIKKKIPIVIKNTFNPNHPGTLIAEDSGKEKLIVKNISSLDGISLVNVGGTNLAGMPGTAERVFKAVAEKKVNVILIAQASSEHTICFAVNKFEADKAVGALKEEFANEVRQSKVAVSRQDGQSIIAVVGDNMRGVPGIAGRIFHTLGKAGINIAAIAQGGSERNVSSVVAEDKKQAAVSAIHKEFFQKSLSSAVFLVGAGNVGGELLRQITNLKVCGLADGEKMIFNDQGLDLNNWKKVLAKSELKTNLDGFLDKATAIEAEKKIFVDCTASEKIAKNYARIIKAGFHIVTPNKKANVLPAKQYSAIRKAMAESGKSFHYDANVGAGLPIIYSIKNLIGAGDRIKKIEGIFSGTLSYLFNNFDGKRPFSELVAEAKAKGYTEPDPREDLNGQDVGRKLLILARDCGWSAELADVKLESLVRPDAYFAARLKKARQKKCVLRYVGVVAEGRLSASLKEVPLDHPLAGVSGADNVIALYSQYYKNPLVLRGAGAGKEVTAAAVLNGINKIINS